jgi:hypothetical protein
MPQVDEEKPKQNGYFDINPEDDNRSDNDFYQKEVKRTNLFKLFLEGVAVDKFLITHQYGEFKHVNDQNQTINDSIMIDDVYEQMNMSTTFVNRSLVKHMKGI